MEGVSGFRGGEQGPRRLSVRGLTWQSLFSLPQLSFSIVSLCNHLTRSLKKKVHLRPEEDLVGECSVLLLGRTLGWPGARGWKGAGGLYFPPALRVLSSALRGWQRLHVQGDGWGGAGRGALQWGSVGFWTRILSWWAFRGTAAAVSLPQSFPEDS